MVEIKDFRFGNKEPAAVPAPIRRAVDPTECPVTVLGHNGGRYFFVTPVGQFREFDTRSLGTKLGVASVFVTRLDWLTDMWPDMIRGAPTFNHIDAALWLMEQAGRAGIWDTDIEVRGVGVWRDGEALILHAGDALGIEGEWVMPGRLIGGALYAATRAVARPAETPGTTLDGVHLFEAVKLWNFLDPLAPRLVLGWCGLSMLGAAVPWRAHVMLSARRGAGKTWLGKLIAAALGSGAQWFNNYTQAGVQYALAGEARAVMLDEAEGESGKVAEVIELLRLMAGEEGAVATRGSAGGTSRRFAVNGTAWLAAINPPQLLPQDRSRITQIDMGPADPAHKDRAIAATRWAEGRSPALRARMIAGWPRFRATLALYQDRLGRLGCDARQADQFGALLAAADLMLFDVEPDPDSLDEIMTLVQPLVVASQVADDEESDARLCFGHLMTRQIENWKGGTRITLGRMIEHAIEPDGAGARDSLGIFGVKLGTAGDRRVLLIANQHSELERAFAEKRWGAGAWKAALLRLEGASVWPKPEWFAGHRSRAVAVPVRPPLFATEPIVALEPDDPP